MNHSHNSKEMVFGLAREALEQWDEKALTEFLRSVTDDGSEQMVAIPKIDQVLKAEKILVEKSKILNKKLEKGST